MELYLFVTAGTWLVHNIRMCAIYQHVLTRALAMHKNEEW